MRAAIEHRCVYHGRTFGVANDAADLAADHQFGRNP
jgi:hypothetical protein